MNTRKIRYCFLTLMLFVQNISLLCQTTTDWSLRTDAGAELKLTKKWNAGLGIEYRRKENMSLTDQLRGSADVDYIINKYVKIGAGYELIADRKKKKETFAYRNRFMLNAQLSYKYRRFTVGWRPRLQTTLMSDMESSVYYPDNYRWVLRNRFSLKYSIPHSPLNPYARFEMFNHLFNDVSPRHYKDRITAGIEYKINRRHAVVLGYMYEKETFMSEIYKTHIIQIGYQFSF